MGVTKARKQKLSPTISTNTLLDESLLMLEDVCIRLLDMRFSVRDDSERMYWQQRFKNIVTPISLALAEVNGTRRFHHHYRHDADDNTLMLPVLENPLEMLAHTCEHALEESTKKLSGVHDDDLIAAQRRLERALNNFLKNVAK